MSKHQYRNKPYNITIGWDSPLNTFFATVFDDERENDFDEPLIWLGTQVGEYPNVHLFLHILSQKMNEKRIIDFTLPDHLAETLEEDQRREGEGFKERPTEIQNFVLKSKSLSI